MGREHCPIWGTMARIKDQSDLSDDGEQWSRVDSPRAGGDYCISSSALEERGSKWHDVVAQRADISPVRGKPTPEEEKLLKAELLNQAKLTTWLVDERRQGVKCPKITKERIKAAKRRQRMGVGERADRLLMSFKERSSSLGGKIPFDISGARELWDRFLYGKIDLVSELGRLDFSSEELTFSESLGYEDVVWLVEYLNDQDLIERCDVGKDSESVKITFKGYERLEALEAETPDSSQAFVAMWFDDTMKEAYEKGIRPGIEDAGYTPIRIDGKEHNNKIDDEIIAEIRRSRFLVADFTQGEDGARGGVYYEAGFAYGLNRDVIFTCRGDLIGYLHFDTRQYNHICWNEGKWEDLRKALKNRIEATLGEGPIKKETPTN